MINNDVIRSLRHMHNFSDAKLVEIAKLGGGNVTILQMIAFTKREDEPGFEECPGLVMDQFLNGLIYLKRGKDETRPSPPPVSMTTNVIFKKLRVAFSLQEEDILKIFQDVDFRVSKSELTALFRKEGHPNYRTCGDQMLRNFLKGLTLKVNSN